MQMVRATQEGLRRFGGGRRPFSITRSAYAGTQRFACAWTGDNVATWEHLRLANIQCQRLATSGMSFIGSDVGGFIDDPSPELYARWVQMAVFHPFFRTHSSGDHHEQEPWSFGEETTALVRKAIEDRYRLLPVVYTTFRQYVLEGTPMLRSLALVAYLETDTYWRGAEFFFGDHLYVVPMTKPGEGGRFLFLPDDVWFSYWDDSAPKATGKDIWVECPEDRLPVFVHAGAVLPHWPLQQFVGQIADPEPELHVWWTPESRTSEWYEDDGDGTDFLHDGFRHSHFHVDGTAGQLEIRRSWKGSWMPRYEKIHLILRALPAGITNLTATVNGESAILHNIPGKPPRLELAPGFSEFCLTWQPAQVAQAAVAVPF
jgi:alpha-glucosidase